MQHDQRLRSLEHLAEEPEAIDATDALKQRERRPPRSSPFPGICAALVLMQVSALVAVCVFLWGPKR